MHLIINPRQLSDEALNNIIQEYRLREDCIEIEFDNKHDDRHNGNALKNACLNGAVLILFDEDNATVTLIHKDDYARYAISANQ